MVEHRAIGVNDETGTADFNGQKVMKIRFETPFDKKPYVSITLEDGGSTHVPYRTKVKKGSFRVVFKKPYLGTVAWEAKKI